MRARVRRLEERWVAASMAESCIKVMSGYEKIRVYGIESMTRLITAVSSTL